MKAKKIIALLDAHKRLAGSCSRHNNGECLGIHLSKIESFIEKNEPLQFILPAFPAKSSNANKTFGFLPDLAEKLALKFLNTICETIQEIYSPGASIRICSDGRVFSDLVQVKDSEISAYFQMMQHIIDSEQLQNIRLYSLDDYYKNSSHQQMRDQLLEDYAIPCDQIRESMKTNPNSLQLFNGMHRFIYEDNLFHFQALSKNKVRKLSGEITLQVIQRSNAFSRLLEKVFPAALRLSIHPQLCGSEKIGIMLLKADNAWATPWHRVVLYENKNPLLIRKKEAEDRGANPVFVNNHFSHYEGIA